MSRPLTLYILQKFGTPGTMGRAIFLPVENKLGNNLLRKLTINIGHLQNIINGFFRLPLIGNSSGHAVLIHHTSVKLPLTAHMMNKF